MMSLSEQVLSFLFAFLYGYISFLSYRLSYKYLYCLNKIYLVYLSEDYESANYIYISYYGV